MITPEDNELLCRVSGDAPMGQLMRRQWLAICMGFVGVLVIIRPGSHGFHPAILLSIMNALLYAAFNLMTRRLAGSDHPISTQLASNI
jgi:drug/metabolite transporter (DMT)-like permease